MNSRFLIIALITLATNLTAQVDFGVKAVYSTDLTSSVTEEFVNVSPLEIAQIAYKGSAPTRGLGMSLYTENEKLFLMGDVLYTKTGRNFELISLDGVKNFKFGFGPELSVRMEQEEGLSSLTQITSSEQKVQGGFNFLVGYKFFDHIHVDLKHTYSFQDAGHEFRYAGIPMEMKRNPKSLELSVGLYF